MTTYDQLKSLQAKLSKEVTDLKKKRDAAKATVEKALAEFQKLDTKVKEMEGLLGTSTPAPAPTPALKASAKKTAATPVVQAAPAGVRLKKDGTPKKKPGPAKTAAPKAASKAAPKTAAKVQAAPAGVRLKKDGTPKKKPGPAPKAVTAAAPKAVNATAPKAAKAVKAVAPKATKAAKVAAPKAEPKKKNRAAEGRRAVLAGERPTLKDAMKTVMGKSTMNSQEVYDALKVKGWLPNSTEPKNYIGYSLSTMKDHFERVADKGRGFYRVKGIAGTTSATRNGESTMSMSSEPDTSLADAAAILGIN